MTEMFAQSILRCMFHAYITTVELSVSSFLINGVRLVSLMYVKSAILIWVGLYNTRPDIQWYAVFGVRKYMSVVGDFEECLNVTLSKNLFF